MAAALVATAFGPKATLYDALECDKHADPSELKKAYRRQALKFHPDKAHARAAAKSSSDETAAERNQITDRNDKVGPTTIGDATLKFQAVSAAYSVLMDPKGRKWYDATGQVRDDNDDGNDSGDDDDGDNNAHQKFRSRSGNKDQQRWDDFFQSVFQEMFTAEEKHGTADSYRGSDQEVQDVVHYYKMCKGNFHKMLDCIVHGDIKDKKRWKRDIIIPAIRKGQVERYDSEKAATKSDEDAARASTTVDLIDSDDEGTKNKVAKRGKKRLRKATGPIDRIKKVGTKASPATSRKAAPSDTNSNIEKNTLVDTDEEEECANSKRTAANTAHSSQPNEMSRKDKLEYRVAKKRKQAAAREMEVAGLLKSKKWSGAGATSDARAKGKYATSFTEGLLSSMEKKYSAPGKNTTASRKK